MVFEPAAGEIFSDVVISLPFSVVVLPSMASSNKSTKLSTVEFTDPEIVLPDPVIPEVLVVALPPIFVSPVRQILKLKTFLEPVC